MHKDSFWLIHTSQGELIIVQDDSDKFDDLVYSINANTHIERLTQLHNILTTQPHIEELEQHLDNFIKDAQFIWNLQQDQGNTRREEGGNVTTTE